MPDNARADTAGPAAIVKATTDAVTAAQDFVDAAIGTGDTATDDLVNELPSVNERSVATMLARVTDDAATVASLAAEMCADIAAGKPQAAMRSYTALLANLAPVINKLNAAGSVEAAESALRQNIAVEVLADSKAWNMRDFHATVAHLIKEFRGE